MRRSLSTFAYFFDALYTITATSSRVAGRCGYVPSVIPAATANLNSAANDADGFASFSNSSFTTSTTLFSFSTLNVLQSIYKHLERVS